MSTKTINIDEKLYEYLLNNSLREPELLKKLREETALMPSGLMQISPEQGQFMGLLVRLIGIRRILEIGVFTGYSSLAMALALPEDGMIVACDISEEYTRTARKYWKEANVDTRIQLKIGPAIDTLQELSQDDKLEPFDLVFIDADKGNYSNYYEAGLSLLRKGGLILVDNVLWSGKVADPENQEEDTVAIRELNQKLHQDDRIDLSLLPIGDGLTFARKR